METERCGIVGRLESLSITCLLLEFASSDDILRRTASTLHTGYWIKLRHAQTNIIGSRENRSIPKCVGSKHHTGTGLSTSRATNKYRMQTTPPIGPSPNQSQNGRDKTVASSPPDRPIAGGGGLSQTPQYLTSLSLVSVRCHGHVTQ